jgi:hypothetical protein
MEPLPLANARRPKPEIRISRETTYVTGPLREDGYVDYVAAMNALCSRGVTLENDAAVPLWQAVGPKSLDAGIRKRYFELLGIPELPEQGDYLLPLSECESLRDAFNPPTIGTEANQSERQAAERLARIAQGPWRPEELPDVAAFLDLNSKPLQTLSDGLRRAQFYSPLVCSPDKPFDMPFSTVPMDLSREISRQLRARAMLRLDEANIGGAWQDTMTAYRLARLCAQVPFDIDRLVSLTLESIAVQAAVAVSMTDGISAEQARQYQRDLHRLLPMPPLSWTIDRGERLWQLSSLLNMAVDGRRCELQYGVEDEGLLEVLHEADPQWKRRAETCNRLLDEDVDWNEVFRQCNAWYDRAVAAFDRATWPERIEEIALLSEEAEARAQESLDMAASDEHSCAQDISPEERAHCLTGLLVIGERVPGACMVMAEQKRQVYCDLTAVAFALAGFRSDHGAYPNCLDQLRCQYIADVPLDAFSNDDLHYQREGDGYLLYSVGPNGVDDGGRNFNEEWNDRSDIESATDEQMAWDDIAIRTPGRRL